MDVTGLSEPRPAIAHLPITEAGSNHLLLRKEVRVMPRSLRPKRRGRHGTLLRRRVFVEDHNTIGLPLLPLLSRDRESVETPLIALVLGKPGNQLCDDVDKGGLESVVVAALLQFGDDLVKDVAFKFSGQYLLQVRCE